MLTVAEILQQTTKNGQVIPRIVQLINLGKRPDLASAIIHHTQFLGQHATILQRLWHLRTNTLHVVACPCGEPCTFQGRQYTAFCAVGCNFRKQASLDKKRETLMLKYGTTNVMEVRSVRDKRAKTNIARYGAEYPLQNEDIRLRTVQTQTDRYGAWGFKNSASQQLADMVKMERYGTTQGGSHRYTHIDENTVKVLTDRAQMQSWHHTDKLSATEIAQKVGVDRSTVVKHLKALGIPLIRHRTSKEENLVVNWLGTGIEYNRNNRQLIGPKELDIVIPSAQVAIEVNGLWYHSERYGIGSQYHLQKLEACEQAGYRLIQLTDYEINTHPDKCRSIVRSALGLSSKLYARKCEIRRVSAPDANQFFEENHLQGRGVSPRIAYGLYHNDTLVSAMSFGVSRYNTRYQYEMLRFCSKLDYTIVGGAQKLFHRFVIDTSPTSIITYCDRRLFTGNVYRALGMREARRTPPNYWYFSPKRDKLYHRSVFQKHKLSSILQTYDPTQSEWENMKANNWNRIWDCGNLAFEWRAD